MLKVKVVVEILFFNSGTRCRIYFACAVVVDLSIDGIWIAGLPETMRIISVGQEYVIDGQKVDVSPDTRKGLSLGDAS